VSQPPDPVQGPPPVDPRATRDVVIVAFASFLLIGWSGLLVPSLIRQVQGTFAIDDAGMGLAYLLGSLLYVAGTIVSGVLAGRMPRRLLLAIGPTLMTVGYLGEAAAPSWGVFLVAFLVVNLGAGIVDAGVNALGMDLFPGRAAMLNRLHLFFAIGAFASPLAVGALVGGGVPWQAVLVGTALAAAPLALAIATRVLPPAHAEPASGGAPGDAVPIHLESRGADRLLPLPLVLLALAICAYVASEIGVSNWLVRYLDDVPLEVATLALSLFWLSIGLGRLVSSFIADRLGHVRFATVFAMACGAAIQAAIVVPWVPLVVVLFAVAGFAAGPVYPTIMAIGGSFYPGRSTRVSSVLSTAGIAGSVVYPPFMGVVSQVAGLWWAMFGAALFSFVSAAAIAGAARVFRTRASEAVSPTLH
jgi:fucose permease